MAIRQNGSRPRLGSAMRCVPASCTMAPARCGVARMPGRMNSAATSTTTKAPPVWI